jgi:Ca2+-binding RTX toxin-like protein
MSAALRVALIGLLAPGIARGGTATLVDGTVRYIAAAGEDNRVQIFFLPLEGIHVIDRDNSVTAGAGCIKINTDAAFCERRREEAHLALIRVRLRDGDDVVSVTAEARRTRLFGGPGADNLAGGAGKTVLDGGGGPDVLHSSPGSWVVVDYSSRRRGIRVTIGDGLANDGAHGEGDLVSEDIEEVRGGFGGDVLIGESDRDRLKGGPGKDVLRGRAGRDVLLARDGARDLVAGGSGFDRARIDAGLDVVRSIGAFF